MESRDRTKDLESFVWWLSLVVDGNGVKDKSPASNPVLPSTSSLQVLPHWAWEERETRLIDQISHSSPFPLTKRDSSEIPHLFGNSHGLTGLSLVKEGPPWLLTPVLSPCAQGQLAAQAICDVPLFVPPPVLGA